MATAKLKSGRAAASGPPKDRKKAMEKAAEELAQPFKNAQENIQRSFGDMFTDIFRNGISSAKDFGSRLKDIFAHLAGEIAALFTSCAADPEPVGGARDAALLATLYAAGRRRAELVALDRDVRGACHRQPGLSALGAVVMRPEHDRVLEVGVEVPAGRLHHGAVTRQIAGGDHLSHPPRLDIDAADVLLAQRERSNMV